jgi:YHS domain-containing protein
MAVNFLSNIKLQTSMKPIRFFITALTVTSLYAEESPKPADNAEGKNTATAEAVKPYPLETCPVSGEKLGEMGKPVVFVYQGQEIKLCCKSCRPKFDKDPAKYLKKLDSSEKK